jgi:hypothetical protein
VHILCILDCMSASPRTTSQLLKAGTSSFLWRLAQGLWNCKLSKLSEQSRLRSALLSTPPLFPRYTCKTQALPASEGGVSWLWEVLVQHNATGETEGCSLF